MNLSQISNEAFNKKISKMTSAQLDHAAQTVLDEIRRYKEAIKNYSPEKMEKAGKPFLKHLEDRLNLINKAKENV